jgi:hypothetical protein
MTAKILKVIGVCIGFFIFYCIGFLLGSFEEERLNNERLGGIQIPFRGDHPSTAGSSDGTSPDYIHHSDFTDYFNKYQYDLLPYQESDWHNVISVTTINNTVYCGSVTLKKGFLRKELSTKFILKLYTDDELILLIEPPRVCRRLLMYSNRSHYEQYEEQIFS